MKCDNRILRYSVENQSSVSAYNRRHLETPLIELQSPSLVWTIRINTVFQRFAGHLAAHQSLRRSQLKQVTKRTVSLFGPGHCERPRRWSQRTFKICAFEETSRSRNSRQKRCVDAEKSCHYIKSICEYYHFFKFSPITFRRDLAVCVSTVFCPVAFRNPRQLDWTSVKR